MTIGCCSVRRMLLRTMLSLAVGAGSNPLTTAQVAAAPVVSSSRATSRANLEPSRVVIAIGSNLGATGEPELSYAELDAERFAQLMTQLGGVDPKNSRVLTSPSPEEVLRRVQWEGTRLGPQSALIVYYSGHGDEGGLHLGDQELSLVELRAAVDRSHAGLRLLIIDSCRDAGHAANAQSESVIEKGVVVSPTPSFDIDVSLQGRLELRGKHQGVIEMRSTAAGGKAAESHSLRAGVFSYHLLSGMRGAADHDGDGGVSVEEAYTFAYYRTVHDSRLSQQVFQEPVIAVKVAGAGPLLLTSVFESESVLVLPPEEGVGYEIFEQGSEARLTEAWSRPTQPTRIGLAAGQFIVYRSKSGEGSIAAISVPFGGTRTLAVSDFRPVRLATLAARGGRMALYSNRVRMNLGMIVDDGGRFGSSLGLAYTRGAGHWRPTLGFDVTRRRFSTVTNEAARDTFAFSASVEYHAQGNRVNGSLALGVAACLLDQSLRDLDGDTRDRETALGGGPFGRAGLTVPFSPSVGFTTDVIAQATWFPEDNGPGTTRRVGVETSVRVASGVAFAF
jgi:hypothetical protein